MSWRQFWKKPSDQPEPDAVPPPPANPTARTLPPHMQRIVEERRKPDAANQDIKSKLARLERSRLAAIYDVEQGELAASPDNPWRERIDLLTQAMKTVEEDRARLRIIEPSPYFALPAIPITGIAVETDPVANVTFEVGGQQFHYEEDRDWAERGHQLTHTELRQSAGNVAALLPVDVPAELRDPLLAHLDESLFIFASDMRDRTLDQTALPDQPVLADLARPCPVCGGWTDWQGRCQACRNREAGMQALKREENRLLSERSHEAEERHRLAERLPIALRRLKDIEVEIEALQAQM